MNLFNHYWYFKSAIPEHICDDIVKYGHQLQDQIAVTGDYGNKKLNKKQIVNLKKKRNSDVVWMDDKWIYKEIHPYIHNENKNAGWNFDWNHSESCQFTKYKKGQYYDWHCDSWDRPYQKQGDPTTHGKIRKLSVTVTLSNPKEYKGGELEFNFVGSKTKKCKELNSKGSMVIFPSFMKHRVKPVIQGERNSLVMWNTGRAFR